MVKILYFGTAEFSAQVLKALATAEGFEVVGAVTQPDRPAGRTQEIVAPPVKITAERLGVPVRQPETLKNVLPTYLPPADIFVVFAYGLLIPKAVLQLPPYGVINIHPSLLPKYRGPTPVQSTIINGDTETGISIMLLDEQLDHGPILNQVKMLIDPDDTTDTLTGKLVTAATPLLIQTIQDWINKKITPVPQDDSPATYCQMLTRHDGRVDWSKSAPEIYNLYRGLTPWPGIWTRWEGKRLKLLRIVIPSPSTVLGVNSAEESLPSSMVGVKGQKIFVSCGSGLIEVIELQLEGKKPVSAKEFVGGYKNFNNTKLA